MTVPMAVMKSVTGNRFVHMTQLIDVPTVDSVLQKIECATDTVTVLMEKMKVSPNAVPVVHTHQAGDKEVTPGFLGSIITTKHDKCMDKCIKSNKKDVFYYSLRWFICIQCSAVLTLLSLSLSLSQMLHSGLPSESLEMDFALSSSVQVCSVKGTRNNELF